MKEQISIDFILELVKKNPNDYTLGKKIRQYINSIIYQDEQKISDDKGNNQ